MKLRLLIIGVCLATAFSACQEQIELDLPESETELVVEGFLIDLDFYIPDGDLVCTEDLIFSKEEIEFAASLAAQFPIDSVEREADFFPFNKVILSTTSPYFDGETDTRVSNAVVELFENDALVELLVEDPNIKGTYRITHDPVVGATYHLEIAALGKKYSTNPQVYNDVPPILETTAIWQDNLGFTDTTAYYLNVATYEKPGEGDYYRWITYINNEYVSSPFFISIAPDQGIDGSCVPILDPYGTELELGDTVVVFQIRTGREYYDFMFSLRQQTAFVGGPFDTPPAPIRGNVNNLTDSKDALGYFLATGITAGAVVVPEVEGQE